MANSVTNNIAQEKSIAVQETDPDASAANNLLRELLPRPSMPVNDSVVSKTKTQSCTQ